MKIQPNNLIEELHKVVKEFTTDEIVIMAVPGMIKNNGKMVDAIQVTIGNNRTKKKEEYIYRDNWSAFRPFIKKLVDKLNNQ